MMRRSLSHGLISAVVLSPLFLAAGCHSYHIDTTIENRTGAAIKLLEVDYPDASFGADKVAAGADFHYRIQVEGSGLLKITYTGVDDKQVQIKGPELVQRQQGRLDIVLQPDGKAEFHPEFTPGS
jgi:hypothetical protein